MKTLGERVAAERQKKGWTQGELANEVRRINRNLRTKQSAIQAIECGASKKPTIIVELAEAFGVDPEYLRTGKERRQLKPHPPADIPVIGHAGARERIILLDGDDQGIFDLVHPLRAEDGFRAVIVRGDSMIPIYRNGDALFFRQDHPDMSKTLGRDCVVITDKNRAYVKRVMKGSRQGLYNLLSYAPGEDPIIDVELRNAWPIEWVRRN